MAGPASAPADFCGDDAEDTSSDEQRLATVPVPPAPPAASPMTNGTEPGTSGTTRPSTQQQPRRPPQQQPLQDAACMAAEEYARLGQLAEAANAEAANFHQLLLQQNEQLVEEMGLTRVVLQQLAAEMRGLREATDLIATTLGQLLAALDHGLREPPQP